MNERIDKMSCCRLMQTSQKEYKNVLGIKNVFDLPIP